MVFTCIWLAVMVPGLTVLRSRQSAGSSFRSRQNLSM
jgi:hypothetical protein